MEIYALIIFTMILSSKFKECIIEGFHICPTNKRDRFIDNQILLEDMNGAGHGNHEATVGCLKALKLLKDGGFKAKSALDAGCGSGILSIAAHKLFNCSVEAFDIDLSAVQAATTNSAINCAQVLAYRDDLASHFSKTNQKYDLIIANVPLDVIEHSMDKIAGSVNKGGRVILSGFINEDVVKAGTITRSSGLKTKTTFYISNWTSLILSPL